MKTQKVDILKYALIITIIFTILLIAVYFYRFHNGLSQEHSDFADFGSYLGSITGLLAFIGVLYTIRDSQMSRQTDNERSRFYKLLGLYQHQVDTIQYMHKDNKIPKSGIEAFKAYANESLSLFYAYIIYNFIKDGSEIPIELQTVGKMDERVFSEICARFQVNNRTNLRSIFVQDRGLDCYKKIYKIKDTIAISPHSDMYSVFTSSICNKMLEEKKYNQIYGFIRNTGDYLYGRHGQYLGQYHRNIYYLLNSLISFKYENDYYKIFRAQLSLDELIVLLFNSMSSQSTKKTIHLLKKFDIFNNIITYKLPIFGYTADEEEASQIMNSLFNEFITDNKNR